jgi:cytochrome c oxidase subunit 2
MNHSGMGGWIEVMDPRDFDNWLSGNANQQSPVAAGQQLYAATLGCASCHGEKGEGGRGPTLNGLFGTSVLLEGGTKVTADETYVRESILNPQAKLAAGYKPIMPTFAGQVTEEQLLQLVAYVKSLNPSGTQGTQVTQPARDNNAGAGQATPAGQGAKSTESQRMNPLNSTAPRGNQAGTPR